MTGLSEVGVLQSEHSDMQEVRASVHHPVFISVVQGPVWGAQKTHALSKHAHMTPGLSTCPYGKDKPNLTWTLNVSVSLQDSNGPISNTWSFYDAHRANISFLFSFREAG